VASKSAAAPLLPQSNSNDDEGRNYFSEASYELKALAVPSQSSRQTTVIGHRSGRESMMDAMPTSSSSFVAFRDDLPHPIDNAVRWGHGDSKLSVLQRREASPIVPDVASMMPDVLSQPETVAFDHDDHEPSG
jgi:hypothetical protein